jgi:hypothetical protein
MQTTEFNNLVDSHKANFSVKDLKEQVDLLIDNQEYKKLIQLCESGYKFNEPQTKELFLLLLKIEKSANYRTVFSDTNHTKALKEMMVYEKEFAKTACNYMASILINPHYIRQLSPRRSFFSNPLRGWSFPNSDTELSWTSTFLHTLKDEMATYVSSSILRNVKENVESNEFSDCSSYTKIQVRERVREIFNLSLEKHHQSNLDEIQKSKDFPSQVVKINRDNILNIDENLINTLPNETQQLISELKQLLLTFEVEKLNETEALEYHNLLGNQLPLTFENYFKISEKNRDRVIEGESANSILKDNITQLKELFTQIKSSQEERELAVELTNLKINKQYLKLK